MRKTSQAGLPYPIMLAVMINLANLVAFKITMETTLWACLGGSFWIGLTEVGRAS